MTKSAGIERKPRMNRAGPRNGKSGRFHHPHCRTIETFSLSIPAHGAFNGQRRSMEFEKVNKLLLVVTRVILLMPEPPPLAALKQARQFQAKVLRRLEVKMALAKTDAERLFFQGQLEMVSQRILDLDLAIVTATTAKPED
jgi:hypothetical protein